MLKNIMFTSFALGLSLPALAVDFSEADAKFALRDTDRAATLAARDAYKAILDQGAKEEDRLRAAEGYLRTYVFEGTHYTSLKPESSVASGTGKQSRQKIFNECWEKAAEVINPTNLGYESPVYYYFRATCLAYEAEASNVVQRLGLLPKLLGALSSGLATNGGKTYEGGGILRVKAGVKGNPEAKGLPGGLYNPEEALVLVNEATDAEAYPGNLPGALFCENFRRKIITLNELKRPQDALATAESALNDFPSYIADGLIPEVLRAETTDCLNTVKELKQQILDANR